MIKLWSLENLENKMENDSKSNKKTPIITLAGHSQNISSCKWMDETSVCTASWDHTIRLWDMHAAQEKCTLSNNSKIFLSIDHSNLNNLIIAGLNDRHIRLYDPRSTEGSLVKSTFTSHTGWGSSVAWSKDNQNLFVSGSYDCLLKLWDIRRFVIKFQKES
jgi:ribosome biogenesis protein YTM1